MKGSQGHSEQFFTETIEKHTSEEEKKTAVDAHVHCRGFGLTCKEIACYVFESNDRTIIANFFIHILCS